MHFTLGTINVGIKILTGSVVVMGVDGPWRISVGIAMDGQITVSGSSYSFGSCALLIVDALEHWRIV